MDISSALACALVYWIMRYLDNTTGWDALARPIVVAPVIGLALGDPKTGIIMGASLEAIFMGISAIGGSIPSDALSGTVISVAYAIGAGGAGAMETGLALAMSIGTLMSSISSMFTPLWAGLAPYWEHLAAECKPRKFSIMNWIMEGVRGLPQTVVIFFGVAYGVTGLQAFLNVCPAWVMTGLHAAGAMMTAVGFGILLSMIWSKEIGAFFFVGFIMSKSLGLSSLGIAAIGACIALTIFYIEKNSLDNSKSHAKEITDDVKKADSKESSDEEAFF